MFRYERQKEILRQNLVYFFLSGVVEDLVRCFATFTEKLCSKISVTLSINECKQWLYIQNQYHITILAYKNNLKLGNRQYFILWLKAVFFSKKLYFSHESIFNLNLAFCTQKLNFHAILCKSQNITSV